MACRQHNQSGIPQSTGTALLQRTKASVQSSTSFLQRCRALLQIDRVGCVVSIISQQSLMPHVALFCGHLRRLQLNNVGLFSQVRLHATRSFYVGLVLRGMGLFVRFQVTRSLCIHLLQLVGLFVFIEGDEPLLLYLTFYTSLFAGPSFCRTLFLQDSLLMGISLFGRAFICYCAGEGQKSGCASKPHVL